jgi:cystathionine gamma-synthase
MQIANYLHQHPKVTEIHYPGLPTHPNHDIASQQMMGYGGVMSFAVKGHFDSLSRFLPLLKLAHKAANLGQVDTIVGPPATTSHVECTPEERAAAGISETLIRLSVGIEDPEDLINDLKQALDSYDR